MSAAHEQVALALAEFRAARPKSIARDVAMAEAIMHGCDTPEKLANIGFDDDGIACHFDAACVIAIRGGLDLA